ncbi:MAG: diadenylate cyclase CdaA [Anaerolineales bacterium]|nr:diadenylate cyclase CdaA [Anaerolineales bacterium]
MPEFADNFIDFLVFVFERLDWLSILDILLVALVFYVILLLLRDTQAMVLLRGGLLLLALLAILTSLQVLPAFEWLVSNTLPALLIAIPVIFAPEIRRALERLGRPGSMVVSGQRNIDTQQIIEILVAAVSRLADRNHGALLILQRYDGLQEYVVTGVPLDSQITPELLLQVFYPNTPLHDGAVIISGTRLIAAACVLPLSASGSLTRTPERQMGLRHRAALGISEVSDAVALVVSEETGSISIANGGRMISNLTPERLENILQTFYKPFEQRGLWARLRGQKNNRSNRKRGGAD